MGGKEAEVQHCGGWEIFVEQRVCFPSALAFTEKVKYASEDLISDDFTVTAPMFSAENSLVCCHVAQI